MADLHIIQSAVASGNYKYTQHAVKRMVERHISVTEVEQAVSQSEVIEDYPEDKYSSSCLLYGITTDGRILHIQVSYPGVKVITAYEPDPAEWENGKVRKTK